jgi:formate hydrogenlyase subunit 3/multisubunit Na+/H+ antiporter MnhD subunit
LGESVLAYHSAAAKLAEPYSKVRQMDLFGAVFTALWILASIACAYYASAKKGQSGRLFFFVALMLSPGLTAMLLFLMPNKTDNNLPPGS